MANLFTKLRRLGRTNCIVDNSDSKNNEFGWRFQSNSKSEDNFGFRLNDDVHFRLFSIKIDQILIKTGFLIKIKLFLIKMSIKVDII